MTSLRLLLLCSLLATSVLGGGMLPKKVFKKIAMHHMFSSCWGKQNALDHYVQVKKAQDNCMQMAPKDDGFFRGSPLDFSNNYGQNNNFNGPFGSVPGILPPQAAAALSGQAAASFPAFMAFLAYQQQQQQQQGFQPQGNTNNNNNNYGRYKRAVVQPTTEDIQEFSRAIMAFKMDKKDMVSNLTCVLMEMDALNNDFTINADHFLHGMWQGLSDPVEPEFKNKMVDGFRDCLSLSSAVPQSILNKEPKLKLFGRQMIFIKCSHKTMMNLCAKQEIHRWLENWYGPMDPQLAAQLQLPRDKYDAALVSMKVLEHSKSDIEKFVGNVIFGGEFEA